MTSSAGAKVCAWKSGAAPGSTRAVRELGWTPCGVDLSAAMLRYARGRLPTVQADAVRLPVPDDCLPAAIAVMAHTDMPAYPAVLPEAARVLRPGGGFVHMGVHILLLRRIR